MKIAVKFCGGCNPRIRRKKIFQKLKDNFEKHDFTIYQKEKNYDRIVAINGCPSACGLNEELKNNDKVIVIGGLIFNGHKMKNEKELLEKTIKEIRAEMV